MFPKSLYSDDMGSVVLAPSHERRTTSRPKTTHTGSRMEIQQKIQEVEEDMQHELDRAIDLAENAQGYYGLRDNCSRAHYWHHIDQLVKSAARLRSLRDTIYHLEDFEKNSKTNRNK